MYVSKIMLTLIYFGVSQNVVCSVNWIENLVKHTAGTSKFLQLRLMTRLDESKNVENPVIEEIIVRLMKQLPTVRINYDKNFKIPGNVKAQHKTYAGFPVDTTATLFLLVIESPGSLSISITKKFIDAVADMASYHYSPRYLIIISIGIRTHSLEELLEYAWDLKMLALTILELPHQNSNDEQSALPILHQLNPFKKEYTRMSWTGEVNNLFPDKVSNMWGYPLRVRAVNVPPLTIAKFNDNGEAIEIGGNNIEMIKIIAKKLNASIDWIAPMADEDFHRINDPFRVVYSIMEIQKVDMETYLAPQIFVSLNNSLRTVPLLTDQFCAIVPISYKSQVPFPSSICKAYLLSMGLVTTFWILGKLLPLDNSYWKIFNIGRLLFFVPVGKFPEVNVDRIIFVCLLATSAIISTNICTSFTDLSIGTAEQTEFNTLTDLDNSGLKPIIGPFLYNKTFASAKGALLNLKNRAVLSWRPRDCPEMAAKYKNVTCFLAKLGVDLKIGNKYNRTLLRIAQPCLWYDSIAFTIGKRSPYRSHMNYIIMNLQSAGIIRFWYEERKPLKWTLAKYDDILEKRHSSKTLRFLLLTITFVGFAISIIVFLAEILIHSAKKTNAIHLFGIFRLQKKRRWRWTLERIKS